MTAVPEKTPHLFVLGGQENTLSIVRHMSKLGVPVSVAAHWESAGLYSRHVKNAFVADRDDPLQRFFKRLFIENPNPPLQGSVLFACCDNSVTFLSQHYAELSKRYILDHFVPSIQLNLLDKRKTLELAKAAGCDVPNYYEVKSLADVRALEKELQFPMLVKPIHSHIFQEHFGRKLVLANDFDDLLAKVKLAFDRGVQVMICDFIPGPDTQLSSYYTYIDETGKNLFHYTKSIIRRCPPNFGPASYHLSEWLPETAEHGERFFRAIGYRGIGNIEFKRDPRDGKLKVIEVNPRFCGPQELLLRSGLPLDHLVYAHLTGQPKPELGPFRENLRFWFAYRDVHSFLELYRQGRITIFEWLKSIAHLHVLPLFRLSDPWPSFAVALNELSLRLEPKLGYLWKAPLLSKPRGLKSSA